jgi:hypothetical protein
MIGDIIPRRPQPVHLLLALAVEWAQLLLVDGSGRGTEFHLRGLRTDGSM